MPEANAGSKNNINAGSKNIIDDDCIYGNTGYST